MGLRIYTKEELLKMKVGIMAQVALIPILKSDLVSDDEIVLMQTKDYSKRAFDLQYPLLVSVIKPYEKLRYYVTPQNIHGHYYLVCSQWYDGYYNDDKSFLIYWILKHQGM